MAAENFDRIFEAVIGHEGGWGDDYYDRGNWTSGRVGVGERKGTKYGIAAHAYPKLNIKALTLADAKSLYRRDYWNKVKGDELPSGVDYLAFDGAVNSGWFQSIKWLQRSIGAHEDGRFGPETRRKLSAARPLDVIERYSSARLAFMKQLSTWPRYKNGWSRRVADVRRVASKMAA
jgi:lysozyme family protein